MQSDISVRLPDSLRIDTLEALIMTKHNLADQTKGLKESIIDQYPMILDPNLLKERLKMIAM